MKTQAMVLTRHGGPDVLERAEVDLGELGAGEVRVRVKAIGVNHLDMWVRRGGPAFKLAYPHRLGSDIAGEVEALGPGARGAEVGQRVLLQPGLSCGVCAACLDGRDNQCRRYRILGENTQGGYAQHVHVPDVNLVPISDALSFHQAAAMPLCTVTAWQMVRRKGEVRPEHTVLVNAAGSGVSSLIIQLCKQLGARVIASTTQQKKVAPARELGADEVIVSSEQDLTAEVKRLTGKVGVDVAFDHVGGELFEKTLAALRWSGRLVTCGATAGPKPAIDLRAIFFKQLEVLGSTMGRKSDLLTAVPMIEDGRLKPVVDRVVSLWQVADAHRALEAREVFGKVVLDADA
jgi:NADPH:quinone reductase-like Zn-dependent oxidoreductase